MPARNVAKRDLAVALGAWLGWVLACTGGGAPSTAMPPLQAKVNFTGTQFEVKNESAELWRDTELEINRTAVFSNDGYTCKLGNMAPGQTATIGAAQCAKEDGTRLNPFQIKPQRVALTAKLLDGRTGLWSGAWK